MNNKLNEIIKPFKFLFIIMITEIIICFSFFTNLFNAYDKNLFEVSLNGKLMKCYYSEKYNNAFFIQASTESYNSVDNMINKVELSDNIKLEIDEYEVYYKRGNRKSDTNGWLRQDNLDYKKVNSQEEILNELIRNIKEKSKNQRKTLIQTIFPRIALYKVLIKI